MYYDQRHAKYLSNLAKGKKKLNPCIFAPILSKERKDFCTAPYFTVFFSWFANLILSKITLFLESSWLKVRLAPLAAPVSLNPLAKGLWSIFSCATCQRAKKYGKIEPYFCTLKNLIISKSPLFFLQRILFYWKIEKLHFWKILDCKLLSHLWQKDCCQFSALWPIKQKRKLVLLH